MAFVKFEIKSYEIQLIADCFGEPAPRYRIKVKSEVMYHDIQYILSIGFDDGMGYANKNRMGVAKNFGGVGPINISVELDKSTFPVFYPVISTEKPVYLLIACDDKPIDSKLAPDNTNYVVQIQLTTDAEVPGDFEQQFRQIK